MACSRRVSCLLGAPAGLEASSIRAARQSDRDDRRANEGRAMTTVRPTSMQLSLPVSTNLRAVRCRHDNLDPMLVGVQPASI
jgi:hypothetical protein